MCVKNCFKFYYVSDSKKICVESCADTSLQLPYIRKDTSNEPGECVKSCRNYGGFVSGGVCTDRCERYVALFESDGNKYSGICVDSCTVGHNFSSITLNDEPEEIEVCYDTCDFVNISNDVCVNGCDANQYIATVYYISGVP